MDFCSMLCGSLDRRGIWGSRDTCKCKAAFLCCSPETITLLISHVLCLVAQSCPALCDPMDCSPPGSSTHGYSPAKNTSRVGNLSLLQGIFPTQEWNRGLLHCRRILYQLSSQGSPDSSPIPQYKIKKLKKKKNDASDLNLLVPLRKLLLLFSCSVMS